MQTVLSDSNPFGIDRYGFLWEILAHLDKGRHLDYGVYDGDVIKKLASSGVISEGFGVDLNKNSLDSAVDIPANVVLECIIKGSPLPFSDGFFDSISVLDVIEHMHDQESILLEFKRVLRKGGKLIITVPKRHVFSLLDVGNFKFLFPRLHKAAYISRNSRKEYKRRYIDCENGLFGDIEKEKMWHQHFSKVELSSLLAKCGFKVVQIDGTGFFTRPLLLLALVLPFTKKAILKLKNVDDKRFAKMNLFCVAEHKVDE
ncbi:MAG: methyltransferase domain-containing protein [Deltaproteobacteria bacterium]|nr:methyltransferase domain-containing protein [Deltaproteobacteria bacterium]